MLTESILVVVGRGTALELALDAQGDKGMPVRVFPTAHEGAKVLPSHVRPRIGAVLVSLMEDHEAGLDLVAQLRAVRRFAGIPITVWAPSASPALVARAYELGVCSALLLGGGEEDAALLTRTIHYWKALNEPSEHEAPARSGGAP